MGSPASEIGPAVGSVVAEKYRVDSELACGGMGRVVRAHHLILDKPVAIKFVVGVGSVGHARKRFLGEARAAQALSSEHVLRVYDVGFAGEQPYIVMELLEGQDLGSLVEDAGPLPLQDAVDYLLGACRGLAEAHAAGIIHRDIKPSNLFLSRTVSGQPLVKVLDFGISKMVDESSVAGETTRSDALLGSPYYMSPEQLRNPAKVDARTDVWSLAVTLHYLLTGDHPFGGDTLSEVTAAVFTEPHRSLEGRPDLPPELQRILDRALVKRPEERTGSVQELAQELAPFASEHGRWITERLRHIRSAPLRSERSSVPSFDALAPTEAETAREVSAPTTLTVGDGDAPVVPIRAFPVWRMLAAVAAVIAVALGWLWTRTSSTPGPAAVVPVAEAPPAANASPLAEDDTPPPAHPSSEQPAAPTAQPAEEAAPAPVAPARTTASPRTKAAVVTRPPPPAKSAGNEPAPRAGSNEPKQPVDIDGIPIVE